MSDTRLRRTQAEIRRSAWPGWIWAVPVAAFGLAAWLGIRALVHGGETVTVTFDQAYGMKADDTIVTLRGVKIGDVTDVALAPDGRHVDVELRIERGEEKYLRSGTQFFLTGARADFSDPSSMKALLAGPEIVMEPGPGEPARRFAGSTHRPALPAVHGPTVAYVVRFEGAAGEIEDGAQVVLRGFRVGTVTSVRLAYDARDGTLSTPVRVELEPDKLGIAGVAPPADGNWRGIVDAMMRRLVAKGLRARLAQDPPLIGARRVQLDFVPGAPAAGLADDAGVPVIPSVASADVDAIAAKADQVMTKLNALPIEETGRDVRRIAARIGALASSPELADSLAHVDRAVTQIDRTLQQVSPQIGPLVAQLRETAKAADGAVAAANRTIGGDATSQNDLPGALRELTDMARSVRALADYLDRHPESLVRGKQKEGR